MFTVLVFWTIRNEIASEIKLFTFSLVYNALSANRPFNPNLVFELLK